MASRISLDALQLPATASFLEARELLFELFGSHFYSVGIPRVSIPPKPLCTQTVNPVAEIGLLRSSPSRPLGPAAFFWGALALP
jgi:hypothetical protein